MEYKLLANKIKIPVLGIGTWYMGGTVSKNYSQDKENIEAIKAAIQNGMTHIDTAELYGNGHAEELVGEAIKGFDRKNLFIATKVKGDNLSYNDLINAAKKSLARLKTDYIDLYMLHWPNPNIPIEETMKALDLLVEKKLVRFIGVSNFTLDELKEAQKYTENKIVANQIEYNLLVRNKGQFTNNMESEIIPYCQKNNIMIVAYRPVAHGKLTKPGFKLLDDLAKKYNKTQAQIAINWLISKKDIIAIPKTTSIEHLKENLGALNWQLHKGDIEKLDNEFPNKKKEKLSKE